MPVSNTQTHTVMYVFFLHNTGDSHRCVVTNTQYSWSQWLHCQQKHGHAVATYSKLCWLHCKWVALLYLAQCLDHSNPVFSLDTLMIYHHTKFGGKIIICSENTVETVIFWLYKPRDLKREDSNQFKKKKMKTVWPMVMDIHTKFGYKRLSGSEDRQADMVIPVYPLLTWLKVCVRVCVCVCVCVLIRN